MKVTWLEFLLSFFIFPLNSPDVFFIHGSALESPEIHRCQPTRDLEFHTGPRLKPSSAEVHPRLMDGRTPGFWRRHQKKGCGCMGQRADMVALCTRTWGPRELRRSHFFEVLWPSHRNFFAVRGLHRE